jgi:hypothetical protein
MTPLTLQQSIDQIILALRQRPERQIKGALLGEQVKKIAPDLDLRKLMNVPAGPGALSKFTEKYLNRTLARVGTSGSDVVYEIITEDGKTDNGHLLWLTFARPGSEQIVCLDISNGLEKATLSVSSDLGVNHLQINSATLSELDKIRFDYTEIINSSLSTENRHLDASMPYSEWSKQLKIIGQTQYKRWAIYRISKIVELFHERLAKLNVPLERRSVLDEELKKSQRHIHTSRPNVQSNILPDKASPEPEINNSSEEMKFRLAVIHVIKNLSDSELRLLKLPAGAIFDALKNY